MSQICPIYLALTAGQVSKFPSLSGLHGAQQILTGAGSRLVDFNLQPSARLCFTPQKDRLLVQRCDFFPTRVRHICVYEDLRV